MKRCGDFHKATVYSEKTSINVYLSAIFFEYPGEKIAGNEENRH
jgi:hypothetical protein